MDALFDKLMSVDLRSVVKEGSGSEDKGVKSSELEFKEGVSKVADGKALNSEREVLRESLHKLIKGRRLRRHLTEKAMERRSRPRRVREWRSYKERSHFLLEALRKAVRRCRIDE